jgi:hypothetical protein
MPVVLLSCQQSPFLGSLPESYQETRVPPLELDWGSEPSRPRVSEQFHLESRNAVAVAKPDLIDYVREPNSSRTTEGLNAKRRDPLSLGVDYFNFSEQPGSSGATAGSVISPKF